MKENGTIKLNFEYKNNKTSVEINRNIFHLFSDMFFKKETSKKQRILTQKYISHYYNSNTYNTDYTNKINIENLLLNEIRDSFEWHKMKENKTIQSILNP